MTTIEEIETDTRPAAVATLATAFADDPVFRWMAHDRAGLATHLRHGFGAMLAAGLRGDGSLLHMTSDARCAAIWHAPDQWRASNIDTLRMTPAFIRSFGIRIGRLVATMSKLDEQHPPEPHYHLAFVGTDPSRQGSGLGTQVITPMIERCDREGVPAYLENSNPANEAFYVRHGFDVTGPLQLPDGAPPMMARWRDAR